MASGTLALQHPSDEDVILDLAQHGSDKDGSDQNGSNSDGSDEELRGGSTLPAILDTATPLVSTSCLTGAPFCQEINCFLDTLMNFITLPVKIKAAITLLYQNELQEETRGNTGNEVLETNCRTKRGAGNELQEETRGNTGNEVLKTNCRTKQGAGNELQEETRGNTGKEVLETNSRTKLQDETRGSSR